MLEDGFTHDFTLVFSVKGPSKNIPNMAEDEKVSMSEFQCDAFNSMRVFTRKIITHHPTLKLSSKIGYFYSVFDRKKRKLEEMKEKE